MINDGHFDVPENNIAIFSYNKIDNSFPSLVSLYGDQQRDWFSSQMYFCLPVVMANQIGFGLKSLFDFTVMWDGTDGVDSVKITSDKYLWPRTHGDGKQIISSAFGGQGVFTIFHDFVIRTPPEVNLFIMPPPNSFINGIYPFSALVESDNLMRDFNFSFKITVPNVEIKIKAGELLCSMIPIQRFYPDSFKLSKASDIFSKEQIDEAISAAKDHTTLDDSKIDKSGMYKFKTDEMPTIGRYYRGEDSYGKEFKSHQKKPKGVK